MKPASEQNKTVIIPCCGNSFIEGEPIWLARHPNGQYLICQCIADTLVTKPDRIIITILRQHNEKYRAMERLKEILAQVDPAPDILILDNLTEGPAETVYKTIQSMDVHGSIVIRDSDVKLSIAAPEYEDFIAGVDVMDPQNVLPDIRKASFLSINENGVILDVMEKQISSSKICMGMYGFSQSEDFIRAYDELIEPNYEMHKLYVSNIITYLIGAKRKIFHYQPVIRYEDWGLPHIWRQLSARLGTYFVDFELINYEYAQLRQLEGMGAQIIFYTAAPKAAVIKMQERLEEYGFERAVILPQCQNGDMRVINSTDTLKDCLMRAY